MQRLNTPKTLLAVFILILSGQIKSFANEKPAIVISQSITLDADINKAWQVLGPEFPDAYKWAASINHSKARDQSSINGSTCSERGCKISGFGNVREKILAYSDSEYLLIYQVKEGIPSMVKYMSNRWQLIDLGNGKTILEMQIEMKTGGILGSIMKGMMKRKMTKMSAEVVEEFKFYVETDNPHHRKIMAAERFTKKQSNKSPYH